MAFVAVPCLIIPSIIWGLFLLAFRLRAKEAIGTIVGESSAHGRYGPVAAPIVEFELPDGRKITFTEKTHTNDTIVDNLYDAFSKFVLKRDLNKVRVLYDPTDPQKARVNSFTYLYFAPVILFTVGACMVLYDIPFFHDILAPILDFLDRLTSNL